MAEADKQIVVIGGSGKTGRRLIERLTEANISYRVGSRSADVPFDWYDESTWNTGLANASTVYAAFYPDLAVPGASDIIARFVAAAKEAQVEHIILLSGRGETVAEESEQHVINSGIAWTVIRCSWFMQNFSENFLLDGILQNEVALPVGADVSEPFVDTEDIADVAFAACTQPELRNQLYELTGPEQLTFPDAVAKIAAASGRQINYVTISHEDNKAGLREAGLDEGAVSLIDYLFTEVLDGRNSELTDGVQRALGRAPRSFDDYVARTAPTGVWSAATE